MIQINIRSSHLLIIFFALLAFLVGRQVVTGQEGDQPDTAAATPLGTAFTYQGRLDDAISPVSESCDMSFKLFEAQTGGLQIGDTFYRAVDNPVAVQDGLFTVMLDFGSVFDGHERFLELAALCPGTGQVKPPLEILSPRQPVSPTPYALFSLTAGALPGLRTDAAGESPNITGGHASNGPAAGIVGSTISGGGRETEPNEVTADYGNVAGGYGNQASQSTASVGGGRHNNAGGPSASVAGGENNVASASNSTVSGGDGNTASGDNSSVGGGSGNQATNLNATVGGGNSNTAGGRNSAIGGGTGNQASNQDATVSGGSGNTAGGSNSAVGGGAGNSANGANANVGGGSNNSAGGNQSTVGGGAGNQAEADGSTVGGGSINQALNNNATTSGGLSNRAEGQGSTVGGGQYNQASGQLSTVAGGGAASNPTNANRALDDYNTVSGGRDNVAGAGDNSAPFAAVGGGTRNSSIGDSTTVAGGRDNEASGDTATVSGGANNIAANSYATVSGGWNNTAQGKGSTVSGGGRSNDADPDSANSAQDDFSTVAGGANNQAGAGDNSGTHSTVGGGRANRATGSHATAGGGQNNNATGDWSVIPGGKNNLATGPSSFAAGANAQAIHEGAFVWSDGSLENGLQSPGPNSFTVLSSGGMAMYTDDGGTLGATLNPGSGAWSAASDRALKENFALVDSQAVLEAVVAMPMSSWNYRSQDSAIRHLGPMAQDFYTAFGLGEDDKHINTVDADGIALAAIQGLYGQLREKEIAVSDLQEENQVLAGQVDDLQRRLAMVERSQTAGLAWWPALLAVVAVTLAILLIARPRTLSFLRRLRRPFSAP